MCDVCSWANMSCEHLLGGLRCIRGYMKIRGHRDRYGEISSAEHWLSFFFFFRNSRNKRTGMAKYTEDSDRQILKGVKCITILSYSCSF
jgi:hypothetical protein